MVFCLPVFVFSVTIIEQNHRLKNIMCCLIFMPVNDDDDYANYYV